MKRWALAGTSLLCVTTLMTGCGVDNDNAAGDQGNGTTNGTYGTNGNGNGITGAGNGNGRTGIFGTRGDNNGNGFGYTMNGRDGQSHYTNDGATARSYAGVSSYLEAQLKAAGVTGAKVLVLGDTVIVGNPLNRRTTNGAGGAGTAGTGRGTGTGTAGTTGGGMTGMGNTGGTDAGNGGLFGTRGNDAGNGGLFGTNGNGAGNGGLFDTNGTGTGNGGLFGIRDNDADNGGLFDTNGTGAGNGGLFGTRGNDAGNRGTGNNDPQSVIRNILGPQTRVLMVSDVNALNAMDRLKGRPTTASSYARDVSTVMQSALNTGTVGSNGSTNQTNR